MTAAPQHTPTPWRVGAKQYADRIFPEHPHAAPLAIVLISDGAYPREVYEANAAFIVRAVNAHEALVAALRRIVANNAGMVSDIGTLLSFDDLATASSALTIAEGLEPNPISSEKDLHAALVALALAEGGAS